MPHLINQPSVRFYHLLVPVEGIPYEFSRTLDHHRQWFVIDKAIAAFSRRCWLTADQPRPWLPCQHFTHNQLLCALLDMVACRYEYGNHQGGNL